MRELNRHSCYFDLKGKDKICKKCKERLRCLTNPPILEHFFYNDGHVGFGTTAPSKLFSVNRKCLDIKISSSFTIPKSLLAFKRNGDTKCHTLQKIKESNSKKF